MKFKKGDKIICIDNTDESNLKLYKEYTFIVYYLNDLHKYDHILIKINELYPLFDMRRFISLEEFRRLKIQKIKNEIRKR
jgi:hypothetical protein